ncbi:MAG: double zinc ribbon domain-containing protein, partial [bacterium]
KFFLDMLFPIECARCGEEGKWICDYCFSKIKFNETQICPLCGNETELGFSCVCTVKNQESPPLLNYGEASNKATKQSAQDGLDNLSGVVLTKNPPCPLYERGKNCDLSKIGDVDIYITFVNLKENPCVRNLIHKLKYNFIENIAKDIAKIGMEFLRLNRARMEIFLGEPPEKIFTDKYCNNIVVVPIPLHKKRLLWRGFNQSEIILEEMRNLKEVIDGQEGKEGEYGQEIKKLEVEKLGNRKDGVLFRRKNTKFQGKAKMTEEHRRNNMSDAFEIHTPAPSQEGKILEGKTVILFDDVITTGVTMEECAAVLKRAGAGKVVGMAIGKG